MKGIRGVLLVAALLIVGWALPASAIDILNTAETIFYKDSMAWRAGIELGLAGANADEVAKALQRSLGGRLETLPATAASGGGFQLSDTKIGTVGIRSGASAVMITTESLKISQVAELQAVLGQSGLGAAGEDVSLQVNVELGRDGAVKEVRAVIDLLRSYFRPEHRKQIEDRIKSSEQRRAFLSQISPGLKRRLLDPTYAPTPREFYDDYLYRQSLELSGHPDAWSLPIDMVRGRLLKLGDRVAVQAAATALVGVSRFLADLFPEDPLSKIVLQSALFRPGQAARRLEFREFSLRDGLLTAWKRAVGLYAGARKFGYYDHDKLVSELSGVPESTIRELRSQFLSGKSPIVVRYFLGEESLAKDPAYEPLLPFYKDVVVTYIPGDTFGVEPLVIPGESIVFQRIPTHRSSILGKYNPALTNTLISQMLDNKWAEYLFWNEFAPGTIPQTMLLESVVASGQSVEEKIRELDRRFPNGWVLKGVFDIATEKAGILASDGKLIEEYRRYAASDFDQFEAKLEEELGQHNPEDIIYKRKEHPAYKGWKIAKLLSEPALAIVQAKVEILREFRVEVIGGRVLRNDMTVDRYLYLGGETESPRELKIKVEDWVQQKVDQLPPLLRGLPFGVDAAILKDGSIIMIESNAGGNSGFLAEREESIRGVNQFLRDYSQLLEREPYLRGMTAKQQMRFIWSFFKKHSIDPAIHYAGIDYFKDRIEDSDYEEKSVDQNRYRIGREGRCRKLLVKAAA